jgi:sulfur-oxidizing protein SoxX
VKGLPLLLAALAAGVAAAAGGDALEQPLAGAGDAERGREVFRARAGGHCVICHAAAGIAPAGDVGPALDGVGARLTAGQIRLRLVDITLVSPEATMPSYYRSTGLARVAAAFAGKTLLDAQQIEDLVAFLAGLR